MNRIDFGDCRDTMRAWAAQGVKAQMCVTSPPYYGLRDYGHSGQLGLEKSPEEYIAALVEVFRCVRDVLANDGTLWVNIGDSYCSTAPGTRNAPQTKGSRDEQEAKQWANVRPKTPEGMKPKDLMGIPWMLAFALRADGWYLRQEIIWHKPNPMPESVTDRCGKAHESLFLLAKHPVYYFDHEAIQEPAVTSERDIRRAKITGRGEQASSASYLGAPQRDKSGGFPQKDPDNPVRNRRSVWTVATRPYKGAHFATFPPELIRPCILAGSRPEDIVLDPFMGSGTTAAVALQLGRQYLGCELNPDYKPLQDERIAAKQEAMYSPQMDLLEAPCPHP